MSYALRLPLLALLLLLCLAALPAAADEEPISDAGRLDLATDHVVVFKDAHGLFVKTATGTADARGVVFTEEVPDAIVLGTLWATAEDGRILGMHAERTEERATEGELVACTSVADLLEANVGRAVQLDVDIPDHPPVSGVIVEILYGAPVPVLDGQGDTHRLPQLVVVDLGERRLALPIAKIRSVEGADLQTEYVRTIDHGPVKRLSFRMGAEQAGKPVRLHLMYFRPGIRWIPTYRVGGSLETSARLALQAEVVNEAEDLQGAPLHLVVGVPNFRFKDVVSPLTLETALLGALRAAGASQSNSLPQNVFSNRLSNFNTASEGLAAEGGDALHLAPELAAQGVQDLFFYEAPALDLAKGARATVPLWQSNVPVDHLYTFDVEVERDRAGRRTSQRTQRRASPAHLDRNDVWHQLRLENVSDLPWTTGASLLLENDRPLAQEILGYTAPGAKSLIPITVATGLKASHVETEISRESRAYRWGDETYAAIGVKGTVVLRSFRAQASPMRVRLALAGRATEVDQGGTLSLDARLGQVNPQSVVTWDLELQPGEQKELTYELTFYAR